jgi:D-serine deaminase-like pyridoxal phosphate-dependent protein
MPASVSDASFPRPLPAPATVGMVLADVDTPAALIDLDAFERNLDRLTASLAGTSVRLRPHAKSHKCPEIARRQIARGAVGVCCQKVSEAEAFVRSGIKDVLVANEVVGPRKLERLAALARDAHIGVCVDDAGNLADLRQVVDAAGVTLDVYIEVNVGANRCGVEPGAAVVELARRIGGGLRFAGLQAYQGAAQHLRSSDDRAQAIAQAVAKLHLTQAALEQAGLRAPIITGAGTGTYPLEAGSHIYNELQVGSYIFMDADYGRNLGADGLPVHLFEHSLFLLATIMSHPVPQRAVVDIGLKAHSVDSGLPLVHDRPGVVYTKAADEHGVLTLGEGVRVRLGEKIKLIPGHCDPTVNLYDWLVCYRGDRVEEVWPITARGAFY